MSFFACSLIFSLAISIMSTWWKKAKIREVAGTSNQWTNVHSRLHARKLENDRVRVGFFKHRTGNHASIAWTQTVNRCFAVFNPMYSNPYVFPVSSTQSFARITSEINKTLHKIYIHQCSWYSPENRV